MRSLRYVPGLRRWKKEKIQMVLILLVISVCFFLMTVLTVLLSSYEKTMEEGRYDSFGEWQYCVVNSYTMEEKLIRDIPYFQSIGAIATYGKIQEGDKETDYLVGTIDDEGRSLSRLRLLEGYWPEKDGEFAAEATWLKMNCPGAQIGDHIKITLRPYPYFSFQTPKKRSYQERDCLELSLVLSGILQDYSYAWSISDCVNLPSVIITEQTATMYDLSIRNGMYDDVGAYLLLLQGDEEWDIDEMEVDLSQLPFHKRSGVLTELLRNDYAYPVLSDDFQLVQKIFAALKIAVIVFGICILFGVGYGAIASFMGVRCSCNCHSIWLSYYEGTVISN